MANHMNIDLALLQIEQYDHDVAAHQDILNTLIPKRLTHFTLHFAKYQAGMLRALRSQDDLALKKLITDSMVIVLAGANALSVDLKQSVSNFSAPRLANGMNRTFSGLVLEYCEIVGDMAKACEVQDHGEDFQHRKVLETSLTYLAVVVMDLAQQNGLDLLPSIRARWRAVEGKQLIGRLRSEQEKSQRRLPAAA